jgi:sec-independent protein translocase protein TatA
MFSIPDMAVAGAVALLLFGPEQLPKVARRAGQLVRDMQNTSQSFIREMERAADASDHDVRPASPVPTLPAAPLYHETPQPAAYDVAAAETVVNTPAADRGPAAIPPAEPGQPAAAAEPAGRDEPAGPHGPA